MLFYIVILSFWRPIEGIIITAVYFALAYAIYMLAVKKLATIIEEKYFSSGETEITGTVVALSLSVFMGLTHLIRVLKVSEK